MKTIFNLFPTPLGIYELERSFTKKELKFFDSLEMGSNEGNLTSVKRNLLDDPQLKNLSSWVREIVEDYFSCVYEPLNDVNLKITQSWTNLTKQNQYHHKHYHPNSLISGVLYIKGDGDLDRIYFSKAGRPTLKTPCKIFNHYNSEDWWMPTPTGTLYLFPSSLQHYVSRIDTDRERLSLAFNTFPSGNWGDDSSLTGLKV